MKSKEYKLHIDLLNYTVITVQVDDVNEYRNSVLKDKYKHLDYSNEEAEALAIHPNISTSTVYVLIPFKTKYETISEVLLHELVHIVDHIIDHYGFEGSEIRAYILQYLFRKIKKEFKIKE